MWIEKTPSGKFKYVEQYTDYMTGKKKRVSITLEKDTASAKRTALETLTRMIENRQSVPTESKEITLEELVEKYREYQIHTVKLSTYKRNFYAMDTIKNILGHDIIVNRLTANYIKEQFISSGRANGMLNEFRVRLFALLHWGYENDYVKDVSYLHKIKPFKDDWIFHREDMQQRSNRSQQGLPQQGDNLCAFLLYYRKMRKTAIRLDKYFYLTILTYKTNVI